MIETSRPVQSSKSPEKIGGSDASPPVAKRILTELTTHGDTRVDPYFWLRNRDDCDVESYLMAENEYLESWAQNHHDLEEKIYEEIKSRVQETDLSFPVLDSGYYYYSCTKEGLQYPIHCRLPARLDHTGSFLRPNQQVNSEIQDNPESGEVLLDENDLAQNSEYFSLGVSELDFSHRFLAYSTDFTGDELYSLYIKDLSTQSIVDGPIDNTYYGLAWSRRSDYLFYVRTDDSMRPFQVWRHALGQDTKNDFLVFEENDIEFSVGLGTTKDDRFILIETDSKTTSETWFIPTDHPLDSPNLFWERSKDVEYSIEHLSDVFLVLTNWGGQDFRVVSVSDSNWDKSQAREIIPHTPGKRLEGIEIFSNFFTLESRRNASTAVEIIPKTISNNPSHTGELNASWNISEAYEIPCKSDVSCVWVSDNPEVNTQVVRYGYTSMTSPSSLYEFDTASRQSILLKSQPVLGDFNEEDYETSRIWAKAKDGTSIPISLVYSIRFDRTELNPCLLYGYGSYEISIDPTFSISRLSLLDRGFVFAIAHVRGGGEMGRTWYMDGKLNHKTNTFTDFIACARYLIDQKFTSKDLLAARGGSAGGLLIGAIANMAPDLFGALVAEVPFVDCLTTILDETLPLTSSEWEEWGNPIVDSDVYMYMKSYCPYDNVVAGRILPPILATAGLNDPRVSYWEPAKWVAKIRYLSPETTVFLKTEMGAGHGGPSGRYDAWRDEARVLAFIIRTLGQDSPDGQLKA